MSQFLHSLPLEEISESLGAAIAALTVHKNPIGSVEPMFAAGLAPEVSATADKASALLLFLSPALPVLGRFAKRDPAWREVTAWLEQRLEKLPAPVPLEKRLCLADIVAAMDRDGITVGETGLIEVFRASGHFVGEDGRRKLVPFRWVTPDTGAQAEGGSP